MVLQRYLDDIEVECASWKQANLQVTEYRGRVHEEALAHAFELLCDQYPVLSARIRIDNRGYLLYVQPHHRPEFKVFDGDELALHQEALRPWDCAHAVSELLLVRTESGGYVALRADHAIADAATIYAMYTDLWRIYTQIVCGGDVAIDTGTLLPVSPLKLLDQRWEGDGSQPSLALNDFVGHSTAGYSRLEQEIPPKPHQRRIRLSEENTASLVSTARDHELTVYALVGGAILVALAAEWTQTPLVLLTVVNLRNLLAPRVGPTETTNLFGYHVAEFATPLADDPIAVGRDLKLRLETAIAGGDLRIPRISEQRAHFSAHISSNGIVPSFPQPEGLKIIDFKVIHDGGFSFPSFPLHGVYTFEGRLSIVSICSTLPVEEMERYLGMVAKHLDHICK